MSATGEWIDYSTHPLTEAEEGDEFLVEIFHFLDSVFITAKWTRNYDDPPRLVLDSPWDTWLKHPGENDRIIRYAKINP